MIFSHRLQILSRLGTETDEVDSFLNSCRKITETQAPPTPHPMAVNHFGHLMSHFGIFVIGLLGVQAFAAWRVSAFANAHLEGGRYFYLAAALVLLGALDSMVADDLQIDCGLFGAATAAGVSASEAFEVPEVFRPRGCEAV